MADNYLENHYEDYLKKKERWLRKKKHLPVAKQTQLRRPDDEAL